MKKIWKKVAHGVSFGFLSSESVEIFDEIAPFSSQEIAEGTIFKKKKTQDREKITDSERIKPKTQVLKEFSLDRIANHCVFLIY